MSLLNTFRLLTGSRPKFPAGTTYQLDTKLTGDLMHDSGVTEYLVRAVAPGADTGPQVGPVFETFDRATTYRAWLSG